MKIWAHRGCSQNYPENTITSFEKAVNIPGLTGIELDIQLSSDGELMVIHDERVDRTTDGIGNVRDMSLSELRSLHIYNGSDAAEKIPTMREVMDLLKPALQKGFRLNIEIKTGVYPYPGIEEKIVDLVKKYDVAEAIVYSSFYAESLVRLQQLVPDAEIGMLDSKVSDCLYKAMALENLFYAGQESTTRLALHPGGYGMDIAPERFSGRTVRAWFGGHLYPEKPTGGKMDLEKLANKGVTDVFLNEPERYLGE